MLFVDTLPQPALSTYNASKQYALRCVSVCEQKGIASMSDDLMAFQERVRRVWFQGNWWFSVVDVVGVLADSTTPRNYWAKMKQRLAQEEGFIEVLAHCQVLMMPALDGKMRQTDCADFTTMMSLLFSLPAWKRRQRPYVRSDQDVGAVGNSGIYAITNSQTQEQYIGSSHDISSRLNQHRAALRRGNHHAKHLQEAWDSYGEDAFLFEILEDVPDLHLLESVEQSYLDTKRPVYNSSSVAQNNSVLAHISSEQIQRVLVTLFAITGFGISSPVVGVIRDALLKGVLMPGPNFALMLRAECQGVQTLEELSVWMDMEVA